MIPSSTSLRRALWPEAGGDGDGRPDIVGKLYHRERRVDVWFNET